MVKSHYGRQHEPRREAPTLPELVREPSQSSILDFFKSYGSLAGKFTRLGHLVLVAPYVEIAPQTGHFPLNSDLIPTGLHSPDATLAERVERASEYAEASGERMLDSGMNDAGWYIVGMEKSFIDNIYIEGQSYGHGRADAAGRQLTVLAFESYMGPSVKVSSDG